MHIFLIDIMSSKVETLTTKPNIMITYCLTVFLLTALCVSMFGALKRGRFRSLASLILVVNVVGKLQQKITRAASRGFLAAARLSC